MSDGQNAGRAIVALLAGGLLACPASAAPWLVGGTATLKAGGESNPFLRRDETGLSGVVGLTVVAKASQQTARAKTTVIGSAEINEYLSRYGRGTNFLAGVTRLQQISEKLQVLGQVTYTNTINPQSNFGFTPGGQDVAAIDYLTIGTRSQRIDGSLNVDWHPTDRDSFRFGALGSHSTYSGAGISSNDQYGGNFSYLRKVDARTSVGVQLVGTDISSSVYPAAQSYQANLELVRKISGVWEFDGAVGVVRQHTNGFDAASRLTLGFNGSLCGTYPRTSLCITFSRQSAPSGIGGLRTDTRFSIGGFHRLTERSRITASAGYDNSTSRDLVAIPRQRYYDASLAYSHDISGRVAVGANGRLQRRETDGSTALFGGSQTSYALAATLSYAFGHTGL